MMKGIPRKLSVMLKNTAKTKFETEETMVEETPQFLNYKGLKIGKEFSDFLTENGSMRNKYKKRETEPNDQFMENFSWLKPISQGGSHCQTAPKNSDCQNSSINLTELLITEPMSLRRRTPLTKMRK
jgi:hypothetical protein